MPVFLSFYLHFHHFSHSLCLTLPPTMLSHFVLLLVSEQFLILLSHHQNTLLKKYWFASFLWACFAFLFTSSSELSVSCLTNYRLITITFNFSLAHSLLSLSLMSVSPSCISMWTSVTESWNEQYVPYALGGKTENLRKTTSFFHLIILHHVPLTACPCLTAESLQCAFYILLFLVLEFIPLTNSLPISTKAPYVHFLVT